MPAATHRRAAKRENSAEELEFLQATATKPSGIKQSAQARAVAKAKTAKRKRVDPTTCDRDYSRDELEFLQAIQAYKKSSGRQFPTWSEVLEVVRSLGYHKS